MDGIDILGCDPHRASCVLQRSMALARLFPRAMAGQLPAHLGTVGERKLPFPPPSHLSLTDSWYSLLQKGESKMQSITDSSHDGFCCNVIVLFPNLVTFSDFVNRKDTESLSCERGQSKKQKMQNRSCGWIHVTLSVTALC